MKLSEVDLNDPDLFERGTPHEMFTLLRREDPVHWHDEDDGTGYFALTKHADVMWVSKHPELFSSERKGTLALDMPEPMLALIRNIMLNMDPPRHRLYRGLVNKAFTPRMVGNLRERIVEIVHESIDGVIERGECEFVDEVAAVLPMEVICEMMGVAQEDRRRIYEIGNAMVGFQDPELQKDGVARRPQEEKPEDAFADLFFYGRKLREQAMANPRDDLATGLVNAELDGEKLSESDFLFFFQLLLVAGHETTRTVTCNGMIDLLRNRDQWHALKDDPSLVDSAVEEILRYNPAVHCFRRQTTQATEIRGVEIPEDTKVMLWYPSVNRDEEVFEDPQAFDIRRSPNDHLSFGVGEHYCLGANLARLELREIFRGIAERFDDIDFAAEPRRLRSNFINGIKEMRVRFKPGPRRLS